MDTTDNSTSNKPITKNNLLAEIKEILDFMYHKGIKLPDSLSAQSLTDDDTNIIPASLTADYNAVIATTLPSTPESIEFTGKEIEGKIADLKSWKIPVVKKYIALSILALLGQISFSLLPNVTAENQEKGILALQGLPLLKKFGRDTFCFITRCDVFCIEDDQR